jgi:hypothetical protein
VFLLVSGPLSWRFSGIFAAAFCCFGWNRCGLESGVFFPVVLVCGQVQLLVLWW